MNLYFIRHLKTEWNAEGRIQGSLNSNLLLDTNKLEKWIDYKPKTSIEKGVKLFVDWYKKYYIY